MKIKKVLSRKHLWSYFLLQLIAAKHPVFLKQKQNIFIHSPHYYSHTQIQHNHKQYNY